MAIDKEFLAAHFQGVEKADEHISAIIAEYEKTNLPLVKNRDEILAEKKAVEKKAAELQEKYAALEAAHKELNEKLESGLPDKEKQIYQSEIEKLKANIVKITDDYGKAEAKYKEEIGGLAREKTEYIIGEEFAKRANAVTNFQPGGGREGFEKVFFTDYPKSSLEPFEYGGKTEYVSKDGKKMDDLFNIAKEKYPCFFTNNNQGGGAPGSSGAKGGGANTVTREQLNSMNDVQKAEFFNKGGKIAS